MHRRGAFVLGFLLLVSAGAALFLLTGPSSTGGPSTPVGETSAEATPSAAEPVERAVPSEPAGKQPEASPSAAATPPPPLRAAAPAVDATLTVDADVPGAQVFIDRQFAGATPLTRFGMEPGRHQINVTAPGEEQHVETIDLSLGHHQVLVRFREVRLDVRVEVVHDHRFGSCWGTLVATPEGLRYDTDNADDAFAVPLAALGALEVDYLEKTLRVRGAGGSDYEFTHPENDADRLLVFQREVNRARERLLDGVPPA